MDEKAVIITKLVDGIEEMIDTLEEHEREDEDFVLPRELAESLREELNELL
jgi:hypothetical protein